MKERVISAIVALLIFIPIFLIGGTIYNLAMIILSLLALKEFLKARESKKELPNFINFISYIVLTLIVISGINVKDMMLTIDFRTVSALLLVFLIPAVLYHDRSLYSITDAFYLIGGIFFLGVSFSLLITLRNIGLNLIIYLFIITIMTDTYAYIIGSLIGRHKLLKDISPNKTLEGMIAGTMFGTLIATSYYIAVIDPNINTWLVAFVTFFLSILGQFGDLVFSAIKRYFNIKDFSNIMPGHGGILDRLDSIIFVILGYIFFVSIL